MGDPNRAKFYMILNTQNSDRSMGKQEGGEEMRFQWRLSRQILPASKLRLLQFNATNLHWNTYSSNGLLINFHGPSKSKDIVALNPQIPGSGCAIRSTIGYVPVADMWKNRYETTIPPTHDVGKVMGIIFENSDGLSLVAATNKYELPDVPADGADATKVSKNASLGEDVTLNNGANILHAHEYCMHNAAGTFSSAGQVKIACISHLNGLGNTHEGESNQFSFDGHNNESGYSGEYSGVYQFDTAQFELASGETGEPDLNKSSELALPGGWVADDYVGPATGAASNEQLQRIGATTDAAGGKRLVGKLLYTFKARTIPLLGTEYDVVYNASTSALIVKFWFQSPGDGGGLTGKYKILQSPSGDNRMCRGQKLVLKASATGTDAVVLVNIQDMNPMTGSDDPDTRMKIYHESPCKYISHVPPVPMGVELVSHLDTLEISLSDSENGKNSLSRQKNTTCTFVLEVEE